MKRYYWIWMTYVTRPMMWVFALCTIGALAIAIFAKSSHFSNPGESDDYSKIKLPIITADQPILDSRSALLEFANKTDSVQIRLGRVLSGDFEDLYKRKRQANPGQSVYISSEELDAAAAEMEDVHFPENVEAISIDGRGRKFLPRIAELESLKRMEFKSSFSNEKLDLTLLSSLKNLEMLQLGFIYSIDSLSPLRELPKLHTLAIKHIGVVTKERMGEVASLPALKTLHLPNVSEKEFALAAITELDRSSSLQSIFVDVPLSKSEMLAKIQSRVPNINVRSSQYYLYRLVLFAFAVWVAAILSFVGMHIVGQFSMPQAQLVPGYRTAHQWFTWALLITILLLLSGLVCLLGGAKFSPVLAALSFTAISCICSSVISVPLARPSRLSICRRIACVCLGIVCLFWFVRHPNVLEEYLMGTTHWIAIILIALAAAFAVLAGRRMNALARARYASGRPLVLSMQDLQHIVANQNFAGNEGAEGTTNPQQRFENMVPLLGIVAIIAVIVRTMWGDQLFGSRGPGAMLQGQIVGGTLFLWIFIVFLIGAKWWQRMPYFASRITRPPSRTSHVEFILDGVRNDLAFQLGPICIAILILAVTAPFWQTENLVVRGIASILFVIAMTTVCYAAVLWGLIIRTFVGLIVLIVVLWFAVPTCTAILTIPGVDQASGLPAYRVIISAMVMTGLAATAVWYVKRKYVALEWGRLL